MRPNRLTVTTALALAALAWAAPEPARAQTPVTPAVTLPVDPVVARVGAQEIRLSDLAEAGQSLPDEYRGMPQNVLFPLLMDQLIDRAAVAALARSQGLDKDPVVARQIARAAEQTLENALMSRDIGPTITDKVPSIALG